METETATPETTPRPSAEERMKFKIPTGDGVIPSLRQCATYEQFMSWIRDLGKELLRTNVVMVTRVRDLRANES